MHDGGCWEDKMIILFNFLIIGVHVCACKMLFCAYMHGTMQALRSIWCWDVSLCTLPLSSHPNSKLLAVLPATTELPQH